ncbi:MAG: hypothetical protein DRI57_28210 [Deltaproteobacteria bacterium]|nr:MAG: hypothetical protein DRI57_28210 [Deltaproteobacteria bacterium]
MYDIPFDLKIRSDALLNKKKSQAFSLSLQKAAPTLDSVTLNCFPKRGSPFPMKKIFDKVKKRK